MDANAALNGGDSNAALNGAYGAYQGTVEKEHAAMQPAMEKFNTAVDSPKPALPNLQKPTAAPDANSFNRDAQGWISAMAVFSSLIGARGRSHGTGALKAFAAGTKGLQEGNQQAFDNAYKTWKGDTEAMIEANKVEMDKYKNVMNDRSLTEQEASDQIKMIAYEHKDGVMMAADKYDHQMAIVEAKAKAEAGVNTYIEKMDAKAKEQIKIQEQEKIASDARYEEWKKTPRAGMIADAIAKGLPPTYYIRGRGKDGQEQLQFAQDLAIERHPDLDLTAASEDYKAQSAALRSFGNGKQADTVRSFNVAYAHVDTLKELAKALQNGDVQAINAAKQRYEQEFGSAAPTNFDAVKSILSDEVNKAAVGGAGALGDREQIRASIMRASSPEQIDGAASVYKALIVGQMQGMKKQYEEATGRKDFERFLLPEVEEDLKAKTSSEINSGGTSPDFSHLWSE